MRYGEIVRVLADIRAGHKAQTGQILLSIRNGGLARLDFRQTGKGQMSGCMLHNSDACCTIQTLAIRVFMTVAM